MKEINHALKSTVSHSNGFWRDRYMTDNYASFKETWCEKSEYNKKAKGIQKELLYIVLKNAQANQKTISRAAYLGNLSIIQWICTHVNCTPSEWALHNAAYSGNLSLVKWLYKKHQIIPDESTMHYASYTANPDVIQWLFEETKIAPDITI